MKNDAFWDELGIAWCAVPTETDIIVTRLQASLRRQSFLIAAGAVMGLMLGFAGALLGAYTLWRGWTIGPWHFVVRGVVLVAISGIMMVAAFRLLPVMRGDQAWALPDMIDLTIARADRLLMAIRLGFLVCALVAVFGLLGTAIRAYSGRPPAMSPILDLAVLAILALGLLLYSRHVNVTRKKFRYLKDALADDSA